LLPASNQKLVTAMGALALLPPDHRFRTVLLAPAPGSAGRVDGDLVLVAGGDPVLARRGPHSLDALASRARAAGVTSVSGALVLDTSRFDDRPDAPGWEAWQWPAYGGPISAFVVDGNRYRQDAAFRADVAVANGEELRSALARAGVRVDGPVRRDTAATGLVPVAELASPPLDDLLRIMLHRSDNMVAEVLVREMGRAGGGAGTTEAGTAALDAALRAACLPLGGTDADGSGLSRANRHSARHLRRLVQAAPTAAWWPRLRDALPLAGRDGTLAGRLAGPPTAGNVRAKTGSIIPGRALTGELTTAGGRRAVFSVLVNGSSPGPSEAAIDALVVAVARLEG
jgi:D-alanyl-D-alanine carboxypeptidase/D-alanyl-D-alanine-endopeptidase (penicillin-binding protein 4)